MADKFMMFTIRLQNSEETENEPESPFSKIVFAFLHAMASSWANKNGYSIPEIEYCSREIHKGKYRLYLGMPEGFEGGSYEFEYGETRRMKLYEFGKVHGDLG